LCGETSGEYRYKLGGFSSSYGRSTGPFVTREYLNQHKRLVHPEKYKASKAQARITKAERQRQEADAAKEREARMQAASERVVEYWNHIGYRMTWTYKLSQFDAQSGRCRRPSPEALAHLEACEEKLRVAQQWMEQAKAAAWESGSLVTLEDVERAQAAGEVGE
jgi:hypothetical protein